ncbi:hypothetical protein IC617_06495 [Neiella sp. HB171785]|uniref:Uncharacterized protein n=1 Tax=Neiella litorisoli TaxID=2771431 RepID=A0A8J6UIT7_9GAMM|nr:hypothetical protein [Neiella litorisoli]MBD1389073.1 hypothetical protein [Neiella litorisoli]
MLILSASFSNLARAECEQVLNADKAGYQVSLSVTGDCRKGMFVLTIDTPDGIQQTLYEAYDQPFTAIWLDKLVGNPQPDIVLLQQVDQRFAGLILYSWQNNHYQKQSINPPAESLMVGYAEQDKVYVRWGALVRQIKLTDPEGPGWRRLSYDFNKASWIESN